MVNMIKPHLNSWQWPLINFLGADTEFNHQNKISDTTTSLLVEDIIQDQIKDIEKSADTEVNKEKNLSFSCGTCNKSFVKEWILTNHNAVFHKTSPETRVNEKTDSNLKDPLAWSNWLQNVHG